LHTVLVEAYNEVYARLRSNRQSERSQNLFHDLEGFTRRRFRLDNEVWRYKIGTVSQVHAVFTKLLDDLDDGASCIRASGLILCPGRDRKQQ
jgi:hypothetical protein